MINKRYISYLLSAILIIFCIQSTFADDYIDKINIQTYGSGQQVIYELNVGSYTKEGTFKAAQEKLLELKKTGVDIVWLMPIYPRGGGINSPYAAVDFTAVNPSYGTINDLKNYVAAAHKLGMKVWLDWVPNHMATNATWVSTHPEYFTQVNGRMVHPNNYGDVYQLNYYNSDLVNAMNECLKFWIDQTDVDGFRCDYISSPTIPVSYWQNTIPMLKNYKNGKSITMLGEADMSDKATLLQAGFDYDYAWGFQETNLQNNFGAKGVYATALKTYASNFLNKSYTMGVGRMVYLTNHDQNYNYDKKTLTQKYGQNKYLLTVLTYTLYGMPMIYNGEETGGDQSLNYFLDTKIDWTVSDPKMLNTLRTLAAIKHTQVALHDGKTEADNPKVDYLTTSDGNKYILAYKRSSGSSEVVVVLNTSTSEQTVNIPGINGDYSLWLNSNTIANGVSRKGYSFGGSLNINVPAKGYLVFVKGAYTDETINTRIDPIIADQESISANDCYYNLQGMVISKPQEGIFIYKGRKYIMH